MPSVPTYQSGQVQDRPISDVRVPVNLPLEAFGGGQSAQQVSGALEGIGGTLTKIAQEEKTKADQVAALSAEKKLAQAETEIQTSVMNMRGKDAFAAPSYAKESWEKAVSHVMESAANDDQRLAILRAATSRGDSLYKSTHVHLADQARRYDEGETKSYIQTSRGAAVLNSADDEKIGSELSNQKFAIEEWAKRNGIPTDSSQFREALQAELSQTHREIIEARINYGQDQFAAQYFDAHRGEMTAKDIDQTTKTVEQAQLITRGMAAWNQVKGLTLSDGTPDEARQEAVIMASDMPNKMKLQVWEYVKARANEAAVQKSKADAARQNAMLNAAYQGFGKGVPLTDALKLPMKYGQTDYEKAVMSDAIKKIYSPHAPSDPEKYMGLWRRIEDGTASQRDLDEAKARNEINVTDWMGLSKTLYKSQTDGSDPQEKIVGLNIKALLEEKHYQPAKRDLFMYALNSQTIGKSADEKWLKATELMKSAPSKWIFFGGGPQYKGDVEKLRKESAERGELFRSLGEEETRAIGKAILQKSNAETWTPAEVKAWASQFGGLDAIKPGSPVHNAVKSLISKARPPSAANIKWVLDNYPNGKY